MQNVDIKDDFLEANSKYYNAEIYSEKFTDQTAVKINNWVKENTKEMIEEIIENINNDTVMYIVNAIAFDGEWENGYDENQVRNDIFTNYKGEQKDVEMMISEEKFFLTDGKAIGFIKPYQEKFSFVAILPQVDLSQYISQMTGESFLDLMNSRKAVEVDAFLPKFSYDYTANLNDVLMGLGIMSAFDAGKADFSRMADVKGHNTYINNVVHKTFIEVNESGTKAAAVTSVEINITSAIIEEERYVVKLDKPFIYAIVDNETSLPIFIGVVLDVE